MIFLSVALMVLGFLARDAFTAYLISKEPKKSPVNDVEELKADIARIKLMLNIRTIQVEGVKK